jgi:hypothetical protein
LTALSRGTLFLGTEEKAVSLYWRSKFLKAMMLKATIVGYRYRMTGNDMVHIWE